MKWLLMLTGLLVAAACQGCCRPGGLFGHPEYGYYGSYPVAPMAPAAPAHYSTYPANPCECH